MQQWNDTDVREVWGAGRCGASVEWGAPTVLAATRAPHVPPSRTQSENLRPRVRVVRCADLTSGDMIISKDLFLLGDQDYLRLPKDEKRTMVRPATNKTLR